MMNAMRLHPDHIAVIKSVTAQVLVDPLTPPQTVRAEARAHGVLL